MGIATTCLGNTLYQKPLETILFGRQRLSNAGKLLKFVRCALCPLADSQQLHLTEQSWIFRGLFKENMPSITMYISKPAWSTQPRNPQGLVGSQHSMNGEWCVLPCYLWNLDSRNSSSLAKRKLQVAVSPPLFSLSDVCKMLHSRWKKNYFCKVISHAGFCG